jgi:DNA integrity scanning protein DisA with diadenylate cyclase activity
VTHALGVVVSQSGGIIRIFKDGRIVFTLKP